MGVTDLSIVFRTLLVFYFYMRIRQGTIPAATGSLTLMEKFLMFGAQLTGKVLVLFWVLFIWSSSFAEAPTFSMCGCFPDLTNCICH